MLQIAHSRPAYHKTDIKTGSNPFVQSATKSRAVSPVKRATSRRLDVSGGLGRQAGRGIIGKGGVKSRFGGCRYEGLRPSPIAGEQI
jgi:hypothetical protein